MLSRISSHYRLEIFNRALKIVVKSFLRSSLFIFCLLFFVRHAHHRVAASDLRQCWRILQYISSSIDFFSLDNCSIRKILRSSFISEDISERRSAQSRISSSYQSDTDSQFIKAEETSSFFSLELDVDREDIQAEIRKKIAVQIIQSVHCRATGRRRFRQSEWRDSSVLDRSRQTRDDDYLVESSLSLRKLTSNSSRWIYRALRVRSSRNSNARAWFVSSLYIWCASLASDFLLDLALEYIASWEYRWMISITSLVHRRKASALRDYQWRFMIRPEKNRISQKLRWSMSCERWAHRRNWWFKTSKVNAILITKWYSAAL